MTITSANSAIEMSIRFNRALETFKYFASNWDENARQILVMQMIKGIKEVKKGNKKEAISYLKTAISERFQNDKDDQLWWGRKGKQYLGEAIHDFVSVAILCQPDQLKKIYQFCQKLHPKGLNHWPADIFITQPVFPFAKNNKEQTQAIVTQALFPFMKDGYRK